MMPGTLKVSILGARDLPIMDKSAETTDAFVEVRFGSSTYKVPFLPLLFIRSTNLSRTRMALALFICYDLACLAFPIIGIGI